MSNEQFFEKVTERFGDKVLVDTLHVSEESAKALGLTVEAIEGYPKQAWLLRSEDGKYICPECGATLMGGPLMGYLDSFTWGIPWGVGCCGACGMVEFRYYHRVEEGKPPVQALDVIGFGEGDGDEVG